MRSPSYILKSNYHERNLQRGFEQHVKKLEEISYQVVNSMYSEASSSSGHAEDIGNKQIARHSSQELRLEN